MTGREGRAAGRPALEDFLPQRGGRFQLARPKGWNRDR